MESRMTVAMRVIKLMSTHQAAAPEDLALLRGWTAPEDGNRTLDELACLVIEAELLRRKNGRARCAVNKRGAAASGFVKSLNVWRSLNYAERR